MNGSVIPRAYSVGFNHSHPPPARFTRTHALAHRKHAGCWSLHEVWRREGVTRQWRCWVDVHWMPPLMNISLNCHMSKDSKTGTALQQEVDRGRNQFLPGSVCYGRESLRRAVLHSSVVLLRLLLLVLDDSSKSHTRQVLLERGDAVRGSCPLFLMFFVLYTDLMFKMWNNFIHDGGLLHYTPSRWQAMATSWPSSQEVFLILNRNLV